MNQFTIKSKKQSNGIWGMPMACYKFEACYLPDERWMLQSAIIIGFAEKYPNEAFEVFWSSQEGFMIKLVGYDDPRHFTLPRKRTWFGIRYKDYTLEDHVLTYIGPEPVLH